MRNISNYIILLLILCLTASNNTLLAKGKGKWKEFTKVVEKEHTIGQTGELDIETKYSNINITTWDKETVAVKAVISVESKSEEDAEEFLEFLNMEFHDGSDYLKCALRNSYHEKYTWRDYLPWNISSYTRPEYHVEYTVQMPKGASLKIENKHGNVNVPDLNGKTTVELKYGDLKTGDIDNDMKLYLKHGNADVSSVKELRAELGYSNFTINQADDVDLESRYSKIDIKEAKNLETESRYDDIKLGKVDEIRGDCRYSDYEIGEINNIKMEGSYSDFTMNKLTESIDVDLRYGDFIVEELDANFKDIVINSNYTDVRLDLDESTEYSLDLEGEHISVPKQLQHLRRNIAENTNELIIKTKDKVKGLPRIKANMRYGSFKVE